MSKRQGQSPVTTWWPDELKTRAQAKVGKRGMTEFVILAVEAALEGEQHKHSLERVPRERQKTPPLGGSGQARAKPPTLDRANELLRQHDINPSTMRCDKCGLPARQAMAQAKEGKGCT
jgi:hypothetical protein